MAFTQRQWPGLVMAFTSALLYSTLGIFVKLAYQYNLPVTTIVALRMVLGSTFLWLALLLNQRERRNWKIASRDWPVLLGGMVLTYGISELAYFMGLQLVPAGVSIFLIYLYPALVVLIAYLLYRERPTRRKLYVALTCFWGCAMLSFNSSGQMSFSPVGIFFILLSALCIALYTACSQRLLQNYSPLVVSAWTLSPVGIVFVLIDWRNLPGYIAFPLEAWLIMLGMAVFATFISLLLFFGAVSRLGAAHTALVSTIEPIATASLAAWILAERMTLWQMFGAAVILGGLILLEWPAKRSRQIRN